jgi:hypothetical protein
MLEREGSWPSGEAYAAEACETSKVMPALECEIWMACFTTIQRKDEIRVSNLFEIDDEDNCKSELH